MPPVCGLAIYIAVQGKLLHQVLFTIFRSKGFPFHLSNFDSHYQTQFIMARWLRRSTVANDYDPDAGRPNRTHRSAILINHWLHWISSIIVMSIAAYFISHYAHNTHLVYWVIIVSIKAWQRSSDRADKQKTPN